MAVRLVCARSLAGLKETHSSLGLRYEFYPLMTRCCGKGIERYDATTNDVYMGGHGNVASQCWNQR